MVRAVDFAQRNGVVCGWTVGRSERREVLRCPTVRASIRWTVTTSLNVTLSLTSTQRRNSLPRVFVFFRAVYSFFSAKMSPKTQLQSIAAATRWRAFNNYCLATASREYGLTSSPHTTGHFGCRVVYNNNLKPWELRRHWDNVCGITAVTDSANCCPHKPRNRKLCDCAVVPHHCLE